MADFKPFVLKNLTQAEIVRAAEADKLQNDIIKSWAPKVRTSLQGSAARFRNGKIKPFVMRGAQKEEKLVNSIKLQTRETHGVVTGISFKFERHGVFVYKGVGRGTGRTPNDWFNQVLDDTIPELADRIAEIRADAVLDETNLKIK